MAVDRTSRGGFVSVKEKIRREKFSGRESSINREEIDVQDENDAPWKMRRRIVELGHLAEQLAELRSCFPYHYQPTMSSSSETSEIIHVFQPEVSCGASSAAQEAKDMHPHQSLQQHPGSASPSQQYTVEEQITTVRIPMRRPNSDFLEILHEGGAHGEVFTMKEMVHHVKNFIIKHQLFDPSDPRVVYCQNHKLGRVLQVDQFTVNEAVPLFIRSSLPMPDSCIRIKRQLVKRTVDSHSAVGTAEMHQTGSCATATVSSTTGSETRLAGRREEEGASAGNMEHQQPPSASQSRTDVIDESGPSRNRRTSVNIEYGDEVDGATPMVQVNLETRDLISQQPLCPAPEEDSFSVQYDSDHFAVEYELESSDHHSESEHSSHDSAKPDYVVVQKESDVEFWADYSDTETSSDAELGEADHWQCEACQTRNTPFYRNCGKCWAIRPHWLPETSNLPSSTSNPSVSTSDPLPAEPCGSQHGYYAASSESNDDQLGSSQGSLQVWRLGDRIRPRRIRVMSASSSDRYSESLVSEEDEMTMASSTTDAVQDESRVSSATCSLTSSQENASSQGTDCMVVGDGGESLSQSQPGFSGTDSCSRGGRKKCRKGLDHDSRALGDVCVVCASRPKTGCIIHGSSGHQVCCYRCAKRLRRKGLPCPVCRKSIQKVIKNFVL